MAKALLRPLTVSAAVVLLAVVAPRVQAAAAPHTPLNPAAGWATAYLVNAALIEEYAAVLAVLPAGDQAATLASDQGLALWRRAAFALASVDAKSQALPALAPLEAAHADHAKLLAARPGFAETSAALALAAASDDAPEVDAAARPGHEAMAASFTGTAMRERWVRLTRAYGLPAPSCPIDVTDVRAFAERQKAAAAGGRAVSATALLEPLASWSLPKVQCLVFALMASSPEAKERDGYEPVHLMRALQRSGTPLARDASLKALTAVRLMQLSLYGETLSLIMDLTDLDEAFRLPYDIVQRAYSLRQKGEGAVALQGL